MTRHSKNSTAHSVYTYHEKKRDTKTSGYGSEEIRLGKDSIKSFDCCCLTLQPCRDPMVTPDGYLYDKEAILEYIVKQKRRIARELKEFSKQGSRDVDDLRKIAEEQHKETVKKFVSTNTLEKAGSSGVGAGAGSALSNMHEGKSKMLPSFWVPQLTPQQCPTKLAKPDEQVRCPMSKKLLRFKDLVSVVFDPVRDDDEAIRGQKKSLIVKETRYKCAVTSDILTNSTACCVLRGSGRVVTQECVDKLIKRDMKDPFNGSSLKESDFIPLQRGSTGFAASGLTLMAKRDRPVMQT